METKKQAKKTIIEWIEQQEGKVKKTKFDSLLDKIFKGEELDENQAMAWQRYKFVVSLRNEGYSNPRIVQLIEEEYDVSTQMAYRIIKEANRVYGEIAFTDKQAEKAVYANKLDEIARIATDIALEKTKIEGEEEEIFVAEKKEQHLFLCLAKDCIKEAAAIKGVNDKDNQTNILNMPIINITSDPEAARKQQERVIDISQDD